LINKRQHHEENWHSFEISDVYEALDVNLEGLSQEEAESRKNDFGPNKLPESQKISLLKIVLHQVLNPLIFILVAAAVASILIGEGKDAVFIFIVIFLNSALGTFQEYNAEKSASSLQQLMRIRARVRRDGRERMLDAEDLVPGDIVLLESGGKVPADIRLITSSNLEIDESFLTGESVASQKNTRVLPADHAVAERINMAYAGSTVLKGRGVGVVVNTGIHTQVGKISTNVARSISAKPPLVQRMDRFIKQVSIFIIVLSVLLALLLRWQGMDMSAIFFFVVALAVSAIPEGLPVALTVALSIATKRMAKRNVIVRKLTSVESLGSCTIIASDKTGTLTVNEQTAQLIVLADGRRYDISGVGYNGVGEILNSAQEHVKLGDDNDLDVLCEIAALANEGKLKLREEVWKHLGDSMDVALLGMTYKYGYNPHDYRKKHEQLGTIPYESENKFSASIYKSADSIFLASKGAVETILDFCDQEMVNGSAQEIDKTKILQQADELAKQGYRVLAFCRGQTWL
jgi:magnesium-transporting ATPase (P-type)